MSDNDASGDSPPRILLVEDDLALAKGLRSALESEGCVVRAIARGAQALETAKEFLPDLVLLDVMMPGVDGWDVLRLLRADPGTADVSVIMLTAADTDSSKIKGFKLGADDYVTKPFSVQELRCRIDAVLRRAKAGVAPEATCSIPCIGSGSSLELVRCKDVFYVEGINNFTYVHTAEERSLCRMTLGAIDQRNIDGFMRVHRSFIVNLEHVKRCGWFSRSAYRVYLEDPDKTEIPVSRKLVTQVQQALGLRG